MLNHKSRQQTSYIPEPTIWYMFDSLAKAGLAMEQKLEAEPGQLLKAQELEEVVHLDIKPGNVFFGDYPRQDSISFAMYPTCKLGDFGSATYRGLALHPQSIGTSRYLERGTPGFLALEQKLRYYGQNRPPPECQNERLGSRQHGHGFHESGPRRGESSFHRSSREEGVGAIGPSTSAEFHS
jgi:serine/threonine protein kinase